MVASWEHKGNCSLKEGRTVSGIGWRRYVAWDEEAAGQYCDRLYTMKAWSVVDRKASRSRPEPAWLVRLVKGSRSIDAILCVCRPSPITQLCDPRCFVHVRERVNVENAHCSSRDRRHRVQGRLGSMPSPMEHLAAKEHAPKISRTALTVGRCCDGRDF